MRHIRSGRHQARTKRKTSLKSRLKRRSSIFSLERAFKYRDQGELWLRKFWQPKIVGGVVLILGVLLLLFPTVYRQRQIISRANFSQIMAWWRKSVSFKTGSESKVVEKDGVNRTSTANEPIKIDRGLLTDRVLVEPPQKVVIPSLSVDLPVVEAKVVNGYWELSDTTASHGVGSANPGEMGNMVVFAHAREGLFLPLRNIKKDDQVYVLTNDRWFRYRVIETKLVEPNQTETIAPTRAETLTMYTCDGFLDGKRLIVTAAPSR